MHRSRCWGPRRLLLALLATLVVATSCSIETKDFEALFGDDFSIDALETAQSSRVFDRNGTLITELRGEQNRTDVGIAEIPALMQNAVVAIEDERFWDHAGVDLKAILRAARSNVSAGGIAQGGSTITQQYVGNVFLDRSEQTGSRKIEEIFMARRFEEQYTKEFILEKYLNWVYFGNGAYGVEAAARTYFGPPACERQTTAADADDRECLKVDELTVVEAATIAGLIQAPGRFNPYINYEAARDRRDLVLLRMYANEYIDEEQYETALLQPIDLVEDVPILEEEYPAAHFVEDVKQWFLDDPRFGATREERIALLFEGGLDIYTTIDLELQAEAEAAVERVMPQLRADGSLNPDAAAVVMGVIPNVDDGHILAMVGGRDFFGGDDDAKFNLASGPGRQAGSSMKPIGLAAALQIGIPITRFYESASPIEITNRAVCGPTWRVRGGPGGDRTLAQATKWSTNTVYAQLMVDIGPPRFVDMAEDLGIGEGRMQPVCAAILGTENVNMVEMATVYSTFARDGVRVDPIMVTSIVNADGTQLYEGVSEATPVLNKTVNDQLTWALSTVMSGTGWRADLPDYPDAGKTGTAQNNADATFVGYTRQRATAVWVGYPDEQIPMRTQFNGEKVEGGTFPALIWHEIMTAAMSGLEPEPFPTPPGSSTTTTLPEIPEEAIVPPLLGQIATEEFVAALQDEPNYWVVQRVDIETRGHAPGTIIRQSPKAGEIVPGGSIITIEVAVAPPVVPVPSVIGLSAPEAQEILENANFEVVIETGTNPDGGDDPPAGVVWAQDPAAGVEGDDIVTVTISVNPSPPPPDDEEGGDPGDGDGGDGDDA